MARRDSKGHFVKSEVPDSPKGDPCPDCAAKGLVDEHTLCPACEGSGTV